LKTIKSVILDLENISTHPVDIYLCKVITYFIRLTV
jgi:hypothetical protein